MTAGRPPKLDDAVPNDQNHRSVSQVICARIEAIGCAPTLCAGEVGASREAIRRWMKRGAAVAEALDAGTTTIDAVDWQSRRMWRFHCDWTAAMARHGQGLFALHAQLERGGTIVEEADGTYAARGLYVEKIVTKRTPDGTETTRTIEVKAPDRAAIEWALERKGFVDPKRVEVTGADGSPLIPDESDVAQLAALEAALDAYERGHRAGREDAGAHQVEEAT